MKTAYIRTKLSILTAIVFCSFYSNAQLFGWSYKVPVQITNGDVSPRVNYQELVTVNTQIPIAAGNMQASGNDIRFSDSCGSTIFSHWVESGINTPSTKIWVMVPGIPAGTTVSLWMFYGNPAAVNAESFSAVFPSAFITGGTDVTLTGTLTYDWFRVDAGDTLFVAAGGGPLQIAARNAIINGVVYGIGRGNQAPVINTPGTGPGGGGTSADAGSGGGSYGGIGGTGGYDLAGTPATGGPTYGTNTGADCQMGSSGGSGSTMGGSGGGAFDITAEFILINGSVNLSGSAAVNNASSLRGGGGGSGGCIKITANSIQKNGGITAKGGDGAPGTAPANDSGGGGGGGRIKLFYDAALTGAGTTNADGGAGGPNGGVAPGEPGTAGTIASVVQPFANDTVIVGTQSGYVTNLNLTLSDPDTSICFGTPFTVTGNTGFSNYTFYLNGVVLSSSASSSYIYNGLVNNDSISVQAASLCYNAIKYFRVKVSTAVTYVQSPGMVCDSTPAFTLTPGTPAGGTYSGPGVTGNTFNPVAAGTGTHDIVYTYTDTASGCIVSRTSQILVSLCVGIALNAPSSTAINIYPVSGNGRFIVDAATTRGEIIIYNVMGEEVFKLKISQPQSAIDLSDKVQGIYFFEVITDKEKTVRKMVKQ